jgi:hypothetical protein
MIRFKIDMLCTYSCDGRTRIFSRMRMGNISAKYNGWSVTNKGNSPWQSIDKYSISSSHLQEWRNVKKKHIKKRTTKTRLKPQNKTNLDINFKGNIWKILWAPLINMFRKTALRYQSKICLTYSFDITLRNEKNKLIFESDNTLSYLLN